MTKFYDIEIEERDESFNAYMETKYLSPETYKELVSLLGNIEEVVLIEGNYRIAFKGRFHEPYVVVYGLKAIGPFGKIVRLNDTDVNFILLGVEVFDILDVDKALRIQTYKGGSYEE